MCAGDVLAAGQVGDGAGDAQDPMHGARAELQLVDRAFQQRLVRFREPAVEARFGRVQLCIRLAGACLLHGAGGFHALPHLRTGFAGRCIRAQFGRRQPGDFHVQVDAVQ